MSRGLGKYQRMILEKLITVDYFYLISLLPYNYKLREYQALHRAACGLEKTGELKLQAWACGRNRLAVTKLNWARPVGWRRDLEWFPETFHKCTDVKFYPKKLSPGQSPKLLEGPLADWAKRAIEMVEVTPGHYEVQEAGVVNV